LQYHQIPDTIGLAQQCMGETPGKTLLDKPAVAPKLTKYDFFNRLLDSTAPEAHHGEFQELLADGRAFG
jgi:hypothetical protein